MRNATRKGTIRPVRAGFVIGAIASVFVATTARAENHLPTWPVELQTDVLKIAKGFNGEFAVYVKDLSTGVKYTFNADTPMYLASGVKVPVMVALFKQIRARQTTLDEELVYTAADVRDGAPLLSFLRVGTPVSIRILLEAMIQQSDNAATDMIIRHVGLENVNRVLQEEGIFGFGPITTLLDVRRLVYREMDTRTASFSPQDIFSLGVTRPLEKRLLKFTEMLEEPPGTFTAADYQRAFDDYYAQGYNTAPIVAMGELLERLARGKIVDAPASEAMIKVMLGTETGRRRVRAGLPADVPLAHKTGTQFRRICDFSVFFMGEDRPIVFAVAVKNSGRTRSEDVVARLAKRAYWHLASPEERDAALKRPPPPPAPDDPLDGLDPEEEDLLTPPSIGKKAAPLPPPAKKKTKTRRKKKRASRD